MTRRQDLLTVVASALLFCILGALIGFALGKFIPGYYRAVYSGGDSPTFDPVQVGLGLGVTQGFVGGIVVGISVLFSHGCSDRLLPFLRKYRWLWLVSGVLLAVVCSLFFVASKSTIQSEQQWMYRAYIETEYLPDRKKLTGEWPKDLRGLPRYIKAKKQDQESDRQWLDEVLRFHQNNYQGMKTVRSDSKTYAFNLLLKGRMMECEASFDSQ